MNIQSYDGGVKKKDQKVLVWLDGCEGVASAEYKIVEHEVIELLKNIKIFQLICITIKVQDSNDKIKKEFLDQLLKEVKRLEYDLFQIKIDIGGEKITEAEKKDFIEYFDNLGVKREWKQENPTWNLTSFNPQKIDSETKQEPLL